jgi:aquaporin Z
MRDTLRKHWPEYLMEAAGLGMFMVSASLFTILLYHPSSRVLHAIPAEFTRRILMGLAMGLTAIGIIYSPWGKQSGAHLNPAVTLTFFRLGKVAPWDAVFYVIAQFAGGVAGVALVAAAAGHLLAHPSVNYVATLPGTGGPGAAFLGEVAISFVLMCVVLIVSNARRFARFTGLLAGACVAAFIAFEAPISGMSMNPARTFGSAVLPQLWDSLWIYFLAPPLGMLVAAGLYLRLKHVVACAKLHHQNKFRCIFCEYHTAHQHKTVAAEDHVPRSGQPTPDHHMVAGLGSQTRRTVLPVSSR